MGHVQDRWYRKEVDPVTEKVVRVKTARYGVGSRYRVRYFDPEGNQRTASFPDKCRGQADNFLSRVENDIRKGSYVDPDAGQVLLKDYAERWVDAQTFEETTRETTESRLRSKVLPFFEGKHLSAIKPTDIRAWLRSMQQDRMASSYQAVCFAHLSAIFTAAVDDKLITSNPCQVRSVSRPKPAERKITPWPRSTVKKVHLALPDRFKIIVPIGAGCGLRQGEIFGLAVDAIDRDGLVLHVVRQLREVRRQMVFAPPKRVKTRDVPLSRGLLTRLDDHMKRFPPVPVTLPWRDPGGEPVTVDLLLTNPNGYPLVRRNFNPKVWHPARRAAGIANPGRDDGMHALRHHYASVLLDAGESIKALSEYLGHTDPGFTLRTYTHLMPSSAERTRRAVDDEWGRGEESSEGPAEAQG
jgi:integrase